MVRSCLTRYRIWKEKASAHILEKLGFTTTNSIRKEDWGYDDSTDTYRWFL